MATESSFDVVSNFDDQELTNALDQTRREVSTRYDLKDTNSEIIHEKEQIVLVSVSDFAIKNIRDIMESKLIKRGIPLKILSPGEIETAGGGKTRQTLKLQRGISQDLAREIIKDIRAEFPKIRAQIQGDAVRVIGKSRDELQGVINFLKKQDYPVALQFENYRG